MKLGFKHDITGDLMAIEITGSKDLLFTINQRGMYQVATIKGLKLSPSGIIKEHPDLKGKPLEVIRQQAIIRLKEKIKSFKDYNGIKDYLRDDLKKHNWTLNLVQRKGHRPIKIKGDKDSRNTI